MKQNTYLKYYKEKLMLRELISMNQQFQLTKSISWQWNGQKSDVSFTGGLNKQIKITMLNQSTCLIQNELQNKDYISSKYKQTLSFFCDSKNSLEEQKQSSKHLANLNRKLVINIGKIIQNGLDKDYHQKDILQFLNHDKITKYSAKIQIGDSFHLKIILQFISLQMQKQFIREVCCSFIWSGVQFSNQETDQPNEIFIDVEELTDLKKIIFNIKDKQFYNISHDEKEVNAIFCHSQELIYLNQKLRKNDILSLKQQWYLGLPIFLQQLYKNWQIYSQIYQKDIRQFLLCHMYKIYKTTYQPSEAKHTKISIYQLLYPSITSIVDKFRVKLQMDPFEKYMQKYKINNHNSHNRNQENERQVLEKLRVDLCIQQTLTDRMLLYFLQQKKLQAFQKTSIQFSVLNRQRIKLKQFISQCIEFYKGLSYWNDLFASIETYFTNIIHPKERIENIRKNIFKNIQDQRLVQNSCLACTKFFYYNLNIYDESVNNSRIKVFPSIRKLKEIQVEVKDQMCGMLNNEGGVILFGCVQEYRNIFPQGEVMSLKQKQENLQRIQNLLKSFHPKLQINVHIIISFIPILNFISNKETQSKKKYTGQQYLLKSNSNFNQHQYLQATFVTRIRAASPDPTQIYSWEAHSQISQQSLNYVLFSYRSGAVKKLSCRAVDKLIKKKMRTHYILQKYDEQERRLLTNSASFLEHKCQIAQMGTGKCKIQNAQQKLKDNSQISLQEKYKQMCLLITMRNNINNVKQLLIKNKIFCQIKFEFHNHKFRLGQKTAILYYNSRFDDLLMQISKPEYKIHHKSPMVISLASYIHLENRNKNNPVTNQDFQNFNATFKKQFPNDFLKIYQFKNENNQIEYYCQTKTKLSTIFIYFYLNHYSQRAKFKSPFNLDKMTEEQRSSKFIIKYNNLLGGQY